MVSGGGAATGERDALSGWLRRQLKGWWCNWRWLIAVLLVLMAYGVAVNVLYLGHASAMAAGGRSALYSSYLVWRTTLHLQTFERILEYVLPFCCILLFADLAIRFVSVPVELAVAMPRRATYHRLRGAARLAGYVLVAAVRLLSWSFFGEAVAKLIYGRQLPSLMIGFKTVGLNMLIWVLIVELGVWLAVSRRITQLWKLAAILVGTMAAWVLLHMGATWYFLKYCFTYGTGAKPWPNIAVMIITGLFAVGFYLAGRFVRVSAPES